MLTRFSPIVLTLTLGCYVCPNTINPVITLDSADILAKVVENVTPATYIRNDCSVRVFAPRATLTIQTKPDTGTATKVYSRLTVVEGYNS